MAQFGRKFEMLLGNATGNALRFSELHCRFKVDKSFNQTPNTGEFRIWNMASDTAARIKTEFSRVVVEAGYEGNYGLIFDGNIKQVKQGKETAVDTFVDLACGDGDKAYNFAVVNKTIAAGANPGAVISAVAGPMAAQGVTLGTAGANVPGPVLPRGKVLYGASRDHLRSIAAGLGQTWSIQDGKFQVVGKAEVMPGTGILLSPSTGLVGIPEQTEQGVSIRCLLNPMLRVNGLVQLRDTYLDGNYKVIGLTFSGDTRGQDWYADIVGKKY